MTHPNGVALLGANMLFVAVVLHIIAMFIQGKVSGKETAAMCILTGSFNCLSALYVGFIMGDAVTLSAYFLFGFTYFLFAFNILLNSETFTGLGNYCLFVALNACVFSYVNFMAGLWVLAFFWVLWGQLWAAFWIANGLKKEIGKFVAFDTYIVVCLNFIVAISFLFGWMNPKGFV